MGLGKVRWDFREAVSALLPRLRCLDAGADGMVAVVNVSADTSMHVLGLSRPLSTYAAAARSVVQVVAAMAAARGMICHCSR